MLIDFEVGHYGDPAFDFGFFLSHLALKACYHAPRDGPFFDLIDSFWSGYCAEMTWVVSSNELERAHRARYSEFRRLHSGTARRQEQN